MRNLSVVYFLTGALGIVGGHLCPTPCSCKLVGPQNERLRVRCNEDIQNIKDININAVSIELYHLDLSKNSIYFVEKGTFQNLTNLKRLDLSTNKVTALDEGCFNGLEGLERLDLSKNQIASINPLVFRPLLNLKKLDLSANKISAVKTTLFHDLMALERLNEAVIFLYPVQASEAQNQSIVEIICIEDASEKYVANENKKSSGRDVVRHVSTLDFKTNLIKRAEKRNDEWGRKVMHRIGGVIDLVAAEGRVKKREQQKNWEKHKPVGTLKELKMEKEEIALYRWR
ncbi:leucine-rich repeat and immunoglobulin-like domain-containing nogo receptor-interacting protein 2 [Diachasma alloeum]|uniref:leucine-rich repeat and immunoglobulin-like domain-containing nogo receptor-interacting protein 2 n=1 Tax=Diachasma alloeum TaxID=454923 RepID=UPI0007382EE7|nr:leucine-rich repeat and immunoglobulin-like domain-containing nogo receptor-interacting protein 2 [Diachasma alloeum]